MFVVTVLGKNQGRATDENPEWLPAFAGAVKLTREAAIKHGSLQAKTYAAPVYRVVISEITEEIKLIAPPVEVVDFKL